MLIFSQLYTGEFEQTTSGVKQGDVLCPTAFTLCNGDFLFRYGRKYLICCYVLDILTFKTQAQYKSINA